MGIWWAVIQIYQEYILVSIKLEGKEVVVVTTVGIYEDLAWGSQRVAVEFGR